MSDDHKDPLWTEEPPPDAEEQKAAQALAEQVDGLAAGSWPEEASELLPTLGAIQAAAHEKPLAPDRLGELVEQAMSQAQVARAPRRRRWLPAAALAASVLLAISSLLLIAVPRQQELTAAPTLLSRPSDALLGGPIIDRAGASQRLDLVFADRLRSYRRLTLERKEVR